MNTKLYHLLAALVAGIWGTTFVSTKVLLLDGFDPAQIFLLRFAMAYVLLLLFSLYKARMGGEHRWFARSWADECMMAGLGVTGGSFYFLTENASMLYTTTTNASLIVCSSPLFATFLLGALYPSERFGRRQLVGSALAFGGMVLVVLNGQFLLQLSPLGDSLAFCSCLSWVVYSWLVKLVADRYTSLFVTRKVFFYGVLTILPLFSTSYTAFPDLSMLLNLKVMGNLLFLGCVASMLCFVAWNLCMARLGAVSCTNWCYLNPVTTIVFAWAILDEPITLCFLAGAALILGGLYVMDTARRAG